MPWFSTDHFRHELLAQLGRAATLGRIGFLVNSGQLCRTIPRGSSSSVSCCDAMQAEFKPGDTVVLNREKGGGNDRSAGNALTTLLCSASATSATCCCRT